MKTKDNHPTAEETGKLATTDALRGTLSRREFLAGAVCGLQ
jgi:hypothetical protein